MRLDPDALARHGPNVPHEFVGLARTLWRKVEADDMVCRRAMDRIEALLLARLRRKPTLRPEHVLEIERLWLAMPDQFRVGQPTFDHPRKRLYACELRLTSHVSRSESWVEGTVEPGLGVFLGSCEVTKRGGYRFDSIPLATVSLHALARRFQRGRDRSEGAVLRDLGRLVLGLMDGERPDPKVVAIEGGEWRGIVATTEQKTRDGETVSKHRNLAIRTFIDSDQWADGPGWD